MAGEAFGLTSRPAADACPDCNADSELVEITTNVFVLEVRHDISCPELARHVHRTSES